MSMKERLPVLAFAVSLALGSGVAFAQDEDAAELGKMKVTGTHIKRLDIEGPSPVLVLDRQDIEATGEVSAAEILRQLPLDSAGSFSDRNDNTFASGGTAVSLRGLGSQATLVLINGRRATNYGFANRFATFTSFVDLNTIPAAAVERIEILKDGASAIYGSDAIAGVINVILREDFEGLEVTARYGAADEDEGNAQERNADVIFGASNETTNVTFFASYWDRDRLALRHRSRTQTADFSRFGAFDLNSSRASRFFVNLGVDPDTGETVTGHRSGECEERGPGFVQNTATTCTFNYNSIIEIPGQERISGNTIINHELMPNLNLHVEAGYQRGESSARSAPTPSDEDDAIIFPVGSPHNDRMVAELIANTPAGLDPINPNQDLDGDGTLDGVFYRFRYTETGARISDITTDNYRVLGALEGSFDLADMPFDWEVGALWNKAETTDDGNGFLGIANVQNALNGIDLNADGELTDNEYFNIWDPAAVPNDPEMNPSLLSQTFRNSTTELTSFDATISAPIFALPAGDVGMALGWEYRETELKDVSDGVSTSFGIVGSGGVSSKGDDSQYSVYAETSVPILESLEAQLALRYEDYDSFGDDWNPKIAARWQPLSWLVARGSYGEGFRAPSLPELFLGASQSFPFLIDSIRCPVTGLDQDCGSQQFRNITTGNEDLRPERSESYFFGLVLEPLQDLTISLDYWDIEYEDQIADIDAQDVVDDPALQGFVTRNPPTTADDLLGIPGVISSVTNQFFNLAKTETKGLDTEIGYRYDLGRWGRVSGKMLWTYVDEYKQQNTPDSPEQDLEGTYGVPENRINLDLRWAISDFDVGVYSRWIDSMDEDFDLGDGGEIASHIEWDSRVSYSGFDKLTLTLGVENMFDKDPPFAYSQFDNYGTVTQLYDIRGRFWYGQMKYAF